jgi:hypothetical protein
MISFLLVVVCYVAAQMLADISSLKIISIAGLSMDAGTLIYPITFTLRDLVHKVAGIKVARILILVVAGINLFMAGFFWLVAYLPADLSVGPQEEFAAVLSPVWRIVVASILAEVLAELIDTEVYQLWVNKFKNKLQWGRVLVSNGVSVPLDSLVFVVVAFAGTMSSAILFSIFLSNVLVKGVTTLLSIPLIYVVKNRVEKS